MKIPSRLRLIAVAVLTAFVSSAHAQDSYVLAKKGETPKPGTKCELTKKMAMKNGVLKVKAGEQNMDGTCSISESESETIEYKAADKVKRTVTAGEKSQKMTMNGQEMPDEPRAHALLKVPVILTKEDGEWSAELEDGKEPTDEQQTELEKKEKDQDKSSDAEMYGTEARKVGETWTVDAADLPFAKQEEDTKGSLKITFKGVEDCGGKKCARLEGPMELTGKTDQGQKLSLKGDVVIFRSLEDHMDMKVDFTGKMEMSGDIPNGSMSMSGEMTMSEVTKVN
ncbi:hypothetical protein KBB96_17610 [Luteolibacter ambystomatis]|uniref:DUF3617 family protein n=1 Tax=Luteolibacter ambystomatis TaxID=2824561 RepID=A0A975G8B8_9BACT|nr:hypothetical protein [Luteolibacter ambystomatis]QUE50663.1 hypothetical protein KBB96_17610 [Luteolibacter ambystomatis]